jgi:dephospho-CoA kinase
MTVVLVTGMSGTGKSTALVELAGRGHRVVDTDYGGWTEEASRADGGQERLWRDDRIDSLLSEHSDGVMFVSGCVANQATFYPRFNAIVLLSAPVDVLLDRIASRQTNDYGKTDAERALVLEDVRTIEPLLRADATAEIDTRRPVDEVADLLESIARGSGETDFPPAATPRAP